MVAGRLGHAETLCRAILAADPKNARALALRGQIALLAARTDEAIALFRRAVQADPNQPDYRIDLATALLNAGRPEQAEKAVRNARRRFPHSAVPHIGLANIASAAGDFAASAKHCQAALAIEPNDITAMVLLAGVRARQGRHDLAINWYRRALALRPTHHEASFGLSQSLLAVGEYVEGFACYENRPKPAIPGEWKGEDVNGKTVLVHAEQGYGDNIQFCRYVSLIAARGARILLGCTPRLERLLGTLPGVIGFVRGGDAVRYDFRISLLSLPFVFQTTLQSIPPAPYLTADPAEWRDILDGMPGLKIGIAWGVGDGAGLAGKMLAKAKAISLKAMQPLLDIPGASYISLQIGDAVQQLADVSDACIISVAERQVDWAATASLVAGLDLVITPDTAVAHLAGALGKPVWVLVPHTADWRWVTDRGRSPWYGTARVFRQPTPGNWASVISDAACDLRHLVDVISVTDDNKVLSDA